MKQHIKDAIAELKKTYSADAVAVDPDTDGGAYVRVTLSSFGPQYVCPTSWIAFQIQHTYPHSDIYPHYVPSDLQRSDKKPLGEAFSNCEMKLGKFTGPAVQVSRKSNGWNAAVDSADLKAAKVLDWMRTR